MFPHDWSFIIRHIIYVSFSLMEFLRVYFRKLFRIETLEIVDRYLQLRRNNYDSTEMENMKNKNINNVCFYIWVFPCEKVCSYPKKDILSWCNKIIILSLSLMILFIYILCLYSILIIVLTINHVVVSCIKQD